MNYKETLFFVAKCLTISLEEKNRQEIEELLKNIKIDWEAVVRLSTEHYVFPALYCNFKKVGFLKYLPDDLVEYMQHITDLNRERNQQIIEQAKEINQLLLKNNITPIFLKGTGNLLEGLYDDIAERMVGDIDFIVSKESYIKTIEILKTHNYNSNKTEDFVINFHWHYPALVHKSKIAAVEIHNKILKKPYTEILSFSILNKNLIHINVINILSTENKLKLSILPKIINDNLYHSKKISLRTVYDVFLISKKEDYNIKIFNSKVFTKFNNYLSCIKLILNNQKSIKVLEDKNSKKYIKSYIKTLENSKTEKRKSNFKDFLVKQNDRLRVFRYAFLDKQYRTYVLKRLVNKDFYKMILGLRTKPTP